ncbi:MAG TPA: twin-arginine translocase subunit TatB [Deltaproteobacteria bacterium]|nr:MAG: hypothetical protein A2X88_01455 [Deltaproteobacteria bacterium GWC2_65_14]HBO69707.1 twin-arginine translocase subunit TatB [Deltaproteobacteria bacterium]
MFGIGLQEMLVILVVVLIFFGPKRLPDLAKSLGKGIAEFKKASDEVRKGIDDAVREDSEEAPPPKEEAEAKKPDGGDPKADSARSEPPASRPEG